MRRVLIGFIKFYQAALSPLKAMFGAEMGRCRFSPTCSQYTIEALERHGIFQGSRLAVGRICRCHPWGGCGDDPVPPAS